MLRYATTPNPNMTTLSNTSPLKTTYTSSDLTTLQHLTSLLHLFHHRNHNQHRRSIWYRHFSLLRKQVSSLTTSIASLNETPTTHLARTRKKARDPQVRASIQQRLVFWQDVMVPRWQRAFSQVVADGRFAVLGLVLMASLAEVCKVTGVTAALDEVGQGEVEGVLEAFAQETWGIDGSEGMVVGGGRERREDWGEVVERPAVDEGDDAGIIKSHGAPEPRTTPPVAIEQKSQNIPEITPEAKTVKKLKRRRKANAIDDLFSGLG